jgi:hypothetical protein
MYWSGGIMLWNSCNGLVGKNAVVLTICIALVAAIAISALYRPPRSNSLNSLLPRMDDLDVMATASSPNGVLIITVYNRFDSPAQLMAIAFNGSELSPDNMAVAGSLVANANGTYSLPTGTRGTLTVANAYLGGPKSGVLYTVDVVTVPGYSHFASFTWP